MTVIIFPEAEEDLENAFDYYEARRSRLGHEMVAEFRAGVDRILEYPLAWQALDKIYRRYRLHRFPYGIVYRLDTVANRVVIVAVMHLSRRPGSWRRKRR